jgi:RNA polymerase sigma-70 factor (ECF subfamily)
MNNMTDEELLTKYLETKNNEVYAVLDEKMRPRLHSFGVRLTRSRDDADDIVQEAMLKLLELDLPNEPIRSAESFLFRMMQNIYVDQKRSEKQSIRDGMVSLDAILDSEEDNSFAARRTDAANFPDKDTVLTQSQVRAKELQKETRIALDVLPTKQKEAIELCHCRSMTAGETATILGTLETTIEMRVKRGIKTLRKTLGAKPKSRPAKRPVNATNCSGEVVHSFPTVQDAVRAGFSSSRLYCSLNHGKTYRDLNWSYANAT